MFGRAAITCERSRTVLPCLDHLTNSVLGRFIRRESGIPSAIMVSRNNSGGSRAPISFTVRFCALVLSASAKDGVKMLVGADVFMFCDRGLGAGDFRTSGI